jgi:3-hydroxymyristoyl/3-hydroxydecanoyl-(acyl carrier protein) dehydratase
MSFSPTVRAVRRCGNATELDLFVPRTSAFFPDHFPRLGVLPGVVQVDWAVRLAREHLGLTGTFKGLRNLKFVNPVLPDTAVTLTLESADGALSFAYRTGERAYSSGKVLFGAAALPGQP